MRFLCCLSVGIVLALALAAPCGADEPKALLKEARGALARGKLEEGLALADKAITQAARNPEAWLVRGLANEALARHDKAVADFSKALELDPRVAEAYQHRGSEQFKLGRIEESIKDFDKYLDLEPDRTARHWQRGISYYYAGRFKDGQKQFEDYQSYDGNDVENGVWRYLCMARVEGRDKARAAMLKIGPDQRVPMKEIYALFSGKATPADVLAAARADKVSAAQRNLRLFYAHLYLGLYYESEDDRAKALEHLTAAVEHTVGYHYMWDVARVHRDRLRQDAKK